MLGDYLEDGGGRDSMVEEECGEADLEVEGRGAPKMMPSTRQGLRAAAVLDGENGDDDVEDIMWEATDEIVSGSKGFSLLGSGPDHRCHS
jgi:hypothetical protein